MDREARRLVLAGGCPQNAVGRKARVRPARGPGRASPGGRVSPPSRGPPRRLAWTAGCQARPKNSVHGGRLSPRALRERRGAGAPCR